MNPNYLKFINLFLRASLASAFLSAVFDRFGWWPERLSAWGDWETFLAYTKTLNPWLPDALVPVVGLGATIAEIIFGVCLIIGFKTTLFAKLSGLLLLSFALSMSFAVGIKAPLDYSVFTASAAAFALGTIPGKYWEIDSLL